MTTPHPDPTPDPTTADPGAEWLDHRYTTAHEHTPLDDHHQGDEHRDDVGDEAEAHGWSVEDVDPSELAEALRSWARGTYCLEAAVALLATTGRRPGHWLTRADFRRTCLDIWHDHIAHWIDPDGPGRVLGARLDVAATVEALEDGALPAASGELEVLHLTCQLAGHPTQRPLVDLVAYLDPGQLALVLDAIAHASAWHDAHLSHTVTGTPHPEDARTLTDLARTPARFRTPTGPTSPTGLSTTEPGHRAGAAAGGAR